MFTPKYQTQQKSLTTKYWVDAPGMYNTRVTPLGGKVHVPNFEGVAGSEDFACATLPTTPLDFQGKI